MKIGIDLLEIERIKTDEKFLKRILTPFEIEYINKFENKKEHIAGIFSAKEAVFKAIDFSVLNHKEIIIKHNENNRPFVVFEGKTKDFFEKHYKEIDISITHTSSLAQAICLVF